MFFSFRRTSSGYPDRVRFSEPEHGPPAGALPVFPRPADLGEIVAGSLDDLGPQARTVRADIPAWLPEVMADPAIMERVIANLIGNALRYSPVAVPPLITATARGDRVELRVIDYGPGIPEAA
jgi:two-component system sensor histidine kinase KdpD